MSDRRLTNVAASVRQRLYNRSKAQGEDLQQLLTRYALERLLYRLSQSPHADRFTVKGAMLFFVWSGSLHRPTKDLDLLGRGDPSLPLLAETVRELCATVVPDDGLTFLADTITIAHIREEAEYGGLRVTLTAMLGDARIPLQIDVGFGDAITPAAEEVEFPTLLDYPAPQLRAYPKETVIAEKFETMTSRGMENSRLKDFFDLYTLARAYSFDGAAIAAAITATFVRRETPLPTEPPLALTEEFSQDEGKQAQWEAFIRRSGLQGTAPPLADVIALLKLFLMPPVDAIRLKCEFTAIWQPGGLWQ